MAVVDLDNAPSWWKRTPADNLSAGEARRLAGTSGAPALTIAWLVAHCLCDCMAGRLLLMHNHVGWQ
jgi:hypothetical protein